ncbi:MAG: 30S ribosomal protein S12 methylthiotransferase RimO [Elusimicrobiota bacterium]
MKKVNIISLGCPKNLVDSETMAGQLSHNGFLPVEKQNTADVIILNTCAFIKQARNETYRKIAEISKKKSKQQKFVVCGCLPQLEKDTLFTKYPKIDILLGSSDFVKLPNILKNNCSATLEISKPNFILSTQPKIFSTPPSHAYIKIAEGCNNRCNYCIIPQLRGNFRSRKMEFIINDVKNIVATGRKEVILIAQDTTMYGIDIYKKFVLPLLLKKIAKINGLNWIRLLYTHPAHFTDVLISELAENEKICKYIDIPIQHTDDRILKAMGRPLSKTIFSTIEKLRKKIPKVALRTTVMVGYPNETEKIFKQMLTNLNTFQFDWLGGFVYSQEKNTLSADNIPQKVKKERFNEMMVLQQKITYQKNKNRIGKIFKILADTEKDGHTEFQAPEIDGKVIFSTKQTPGKILHSKISSVKNVYDLIT